ncbi:hypothetical protein CWN24_14780 [Klebsiella pneumoniae]|nr:hypothetical protein CWN24_14780 [Klebsiella pneumoniae]
MFTPRLAVLGAGLMGVGIACHFARHGHAVRLYDTDPQRLAEVPAVASAILRELEASGQQDPADRDAVLARLTPTPTLNALADATLLIEAIPERLALKHALYAELETLIADETIIASNTSGLPPDLGMSVERFYNPLVRRLAALPKPVICAVNGVAAGAGATLALGCDIVLAARSAKFVMAFSKLGLVPDCGGSWFLPRVAGRARAMGLALLGDSLSAEQAAQWGIIWQLVDDSELADTSLQLARHLAAQPTFGLGLIKKALLASETNSLDAQLDLERDYQRLAGRSDDYREGVSAFLAKRPPQFSGK